MTPEEVLARIRELEKINERNADQNKELEQLIQQRDEAMTILQRENQALKRKEELRAIAQEFGATDEQLQAAIDGDGGKEDFMRTLLADKKTIDVKVGGTPDADNMERAIVDALVYRAGGKVPEDKTFVHATLTEVGRALTGAHTSMSPDDVFERTMTTSTLPSLLRDGLNRVLAQQFDAYPVTYKRFVQEIDLPDFRQLDRYTRLSFGALDPIAEGSPLNEKQYAESKEPLKLGSYGNKLQFTREMFINDDLNALTTMVSDLAEAASKRAEITVYDVLQNGVLGDGTNVFTPGHQNVGSFAMDEDGLASARVKMFRQKAADGSDLIIQPKYLIVPPELEIKARKLIASTATTKANENNGVINPHHNTLEIIVSPFLPSNKWYLLADRRTITAAYLRGSGRKPQIKMFNNQTLLSTTFEGIFDFAAGADDFRGFVRGEI